MGGGSSRGHGSSALGFRSFAHSPTSCHFCPLKHALAWGRVALRLRPVICTLTRSSTHSGWEAGWVGRGSVAWGGVVGWGGVWGGAGRGGAGVGRSRVWVTNDRFAETARARPKPSAQATALASAQTNPCPVPEPNSRKMSKNDLDKRKPSKSELTASPNLCPAACR